MTAHRDHPEAVRQSAAGELDTRHFRRLINYSGSCQKPNSGHIVREVRSLMRKSNSNFLYTTGTFLFVGLDLLPHIHKCHPLQHRDEFYGAEAVQSSAAVMSTRPQIDRLAPLGSRRTLGRWAGLEDWTETLLNSNTRQDGDWLESEPSTAWRCRSFPGMRRRIPRNWPECLVDRCLYRLIFGSVKRRLSVTADIITSSNVNICKCH